MNPTSIVKTGCAVNFNSLDNQKFLKHWQKRVRIAFKVSVNT